MMVGKTPGSALARSGACAAVCVHLLALAYQEFYFYPWAVEPYHYLIGMALAFGLQIWTAAQVLGGIRTLRYMVISVVISLCAIFFMGTTLWFVLIDSYEGWGPLVACIWTLMLTPVVYSLVSFGVIHFMLKKQSSVST